MTDGRPDEGRRRFSARAEQSAVTGPAKLDTTPETLQAMAVLAADAHSVVALGQEHFDSEEGRLARHAADAIVIKFHELCERLPEDVRAAHPSVPWDQIRGMRNRLGHHYQTSDYRVVWNTIRTDLPAVVSELLPPSN